MVKMTFSEYDEIIEKFGKMPQHEYWPTEDEIQCFYKDPEKWLLFALFLSETNSSPNNDDDRGKRRTLMKFINNNLELVYDETIMDETDGT